MQKQIYDVVEIEMTTTSIVGEYLPGVDVTSESFRISNITYDFFQNQACIDLIYFDFNNTRHYTVLANESLNEDMIAALFAAQIIADIDMPIAYNSDAVEEEDNCALEYDDDYDDAYDCEDDGGYGTREDMPNEKLADEYLLDESIDDDDLDAEEAGHDDETF